MFQSSSDSKQKTAEAAKVEFQGILDNFFESNQILAWTLVIAGLVILVAIAYYVIDLLRQKMQDDPAELASQKMSELEQLKSTNYMTDEERKRLSTGPVLGSPDEPLDPELAEFRKIKQARESKQRVEENEMFREIDDQPND